MKTTFFAAASLSLLSAMAAAQAGPPPKEVADQLKKLAPYLGEYTVNMNWQGIESTGKSVWQLDIEGWIVKVQFLLTDTEGNKRENRLLITYDADMKKFRIWRFETMGILPEPEGTIRFEGTDLITEWNMTNPYGVKGIYQNVIRLKGPNKDLYTKTQFIEPGKEPFVINESNYPRVKKAGAR